MTGRTVTVVAPGPLATIQDGGRAGLGHLGIGRSGAVDQPSLRRANLLVGNDSLAAGIEMTFGGTRLRFDDDAVVALSGAPCEVQVDGRNIRFDTPVPVTAGQELRCRTPHIGVRSYLAVDGGFDVPPVLGSRSTDTLSGLGPPRLAAGMSLLLGRPSTIRASMPEVPAIDSFPGTPMLTVLPGPRADWFTPNALDLLRTTDWTVTPQADRVGIRLAGSPLLRRVERELPPEPMVAGALQVPPDGRPILFLADHPVTGGYPVIGVVTEADLPTAAQLRPGQHVRFAAPAR